MSVGGHEPTQGGGGSDATGGQGGAGGSIETECEPATTATRPCYTGPSDTQGIGACVGGTQTCNAEGQWGACEGEVTPQTEDCDEGLVDEDCNGLINNMGVSCACAPNEVASCYTGPTQTRDIGTCSDGTQTCSSDGRTLGPCGGDVIPATENCDNELDDDCNGSVNNGCPCTGLPACYGGPDGTEGKGICVGGVRTCNEDSQWGNCEGQVLPGKEDCATPEDEDCDGATSTDEGDGCVCVPNAQADCYTGTTGGPGVGICKSGKKTCDADGKGWSTCVGQVTPEPFDLSGTAADEDCSGAPEAIATGEAHSCSIVGGELKCWGNNGSFQLGVSTKFADSQGANNTPDPQTVLIPSGTPVAVGAGLAHACALLDTGTVQCWGDGGYMQLGVGGIDHTEERKTIHFDPTAQTPTPIDAIAIAVGFRFSCALLVGTEGEVYCWGDNYNGQLGTVSGGITNEPQKSATPLKVILPPLDPAIAIAAGQSHACAVLNSGSAYCWGHNGSGQLGFGGSGDGPLAPKLVVPKVGTDTAFVGLVNIAAGYAHTCAVTDSEKLYCWGDNDYGQLGIGSTSNKETKAIAVGGNFVTVAGGLAHTCATKSDNSIWCWGDNAYGKLGKGNDDDNTSNYAPASLAIGGAIGIASGKNHSCALIRPSTQSEVYCWGLKNQNGSTSTQLSPTPITAP